MQNIRSSDIVPTESEEMQSLFRYCAVEMRRYPELDMLVHTPNEGKRTITEGGRLKNEGLRKGYPDITLYVPKNGYNGLMIELKRQRGSRKTPEQKKWIKNLNAFGYAAAFCYGWEEAWQFIEAYLSCSENMKHEQHMKIVRQYVLRSLRETEGELKS